MVVLRAEDVRKLNDEEIEKKLEELNMEMLDIGSTNPGRKKEIRKAIARIYTVMRERKNKPKESLVKPAKKKAS